MKKVLREEVSNVKPESSKLPRRQFFASGATLAVSAVALQSPTNVRAQSVGSATTGKQSANVAFETETGNKIYSLPRDHALHAGDWYRGAEYQETN